MNRTEAEEHLRVIRSLMEKATIYRAISAPTALVGGLASLANGLALFLWWRPLPNGIGQERFQLWFLAGWGAVLAVTGIANTIFIWRDARRREEPFISGGMKLALMALFPAMLCGAVFSAFFVWSERPYWLPFVWMFCYALGLLATNSFAPRSIALLGWSFLLSGCVTLLVLARLSHLAWWGRGETPMPAAANLLMVATFGLFHLIYAACTWPRAGRSWNVADAGAGE